MISSMISIKHNHNNEKANGKTATFFTFAIYAILNIFFNAKTFVFYFTIYDTYFILLRRLKS